jgi:hypothetical protein
MTLKEEIANFEKHVDRSGGPGACHLWMGTVSKTSGYGMARWMKYPIQAHRLAWVLEYGFIPQGMNVNHDCPAGDNPLCLNPRHLWTGTQKDNIADMIRKGRRVLAGSTGYRFTKDDYAHMKALNDVMTQEQIAGLYGTSREYVNQIVNGHVGNGDRHAPRRNLHLAKLTVERVAVIKRKLAQGVGCRTLARENGVDRCTISHIKHGRNWKYVEAAA